MTFYGLAPMKFGARPQAGMTALRFFLGGVNHPIMTEALYSGSTLLFLR